MESKVKVQEDLYQRIAKAQINFKKSPKERLSSEAYLTVRLKSAEDLWKQFAENHSDIVRDTDSDTYKASRYATSDLYDKTQELFTLYKFEVMEILDNVKERRPQPSHDGHTAATFKATTKDQSLKLPKISIPTFSGKYTQWTSFRDLFQSLVHNNETLDNVQKLHYLKAQLRDEAEQLLRHIPITSENYQLCWNQLEDRYDNKRYLSNCILKKFMGQRSLTSESASALRELLDCTNECLFALQNLGIDVNSWDTIVIYILSLKLDSETRKHWELKISESANVLPSLKQFKEFIGIRSRALEFIEPKLLNKSRSHVTQVHYSSSEALTCVYCHESHRLCHCKKFSNDDIDTRRNFVQSNNLCFNCLEPNHSVYSCRHVSRCRLCKKKHHTLLHPKNTTPSTDASRSTKPDIAPAVSPSQGTDSSAPSNVTACFSSASSQVLLATAVVNAQSKSGSLVTLRCLIDQGSQASFVTESAVQLLGLRKTPHNSSIVGIGSDSNSSLASKSRVSIQIQALHDPDVKLSIQAFVLNKLTSMLPSAQIVVELWSQLSDLTLADPSFGTPNKIDLLLGADVYGRVLLEGVIKGPPGTPIAQKTTLGWILSGPIRVPESEGEPKMLCNHVHVNLENDLLKKFWEQESDVAVTQSHFTEDEEKCEQTFASTTQRDNSGRYVVNLPFRDEDPKCQYGNSREIATKRFSQQERRLLKDPNLKQTYTEVIKEYLQLGHMEVVPKTQVDNPKAVYLPHHAVVREKKDTTKVRVVFNASEPGTNGVSLNDDLLVGPTLQDDLRHIILRWRSHPICLVSDIVKMYRQIKVNERDTDFQRLLWRDHPNDDLQHLRILRVTFGTASAPYLAVRSLQQLSRDDGGEYPSTSEKIRKDFYMDDLMTGCETVKEGKRIYQEMTKLLLGGGFELQKWSSNSDELLKEIDKDEGETDRNRKIKIDTYLKILGLTWNRNDDAFEYAVQLPPVTLPVTKRKVISDISRLFDPLGWLAPVIITAKIFIQRLWLSGIEWDDELPPQLLKDWLTYRHDLQQLTKFKLPRWYNTRSDDVLNELQGFCDASNDGFAAVVYLRVIDSQGNIHISLVTSKTKVAPIKQISIPRLELCGAVLLTKLLVEVASVLSINKTQIHAWTDSTIVLAWLNSRPNRWKTYVANRVTEIITAVEPQQWSHVSSKDNPADCASRGTKNLEHEELWQEGPRWLKEKNINYKNPDRQDTNLEENKRKICAVNTYPNPNEDSTEDIFLRFSSLTKLIRVVALIKRWKPRSNKQSPSKWITTQAIQDGLKTCIKICQAKEFLEETARLKEGKEISKRSKLTTLNPFIDEEGILRVGGRLQHAPIATEMKHPMILPQRSAFTALLIADAHTRTLNGGPQLMLNHLRSKYWIVGAKHLIKAAVRKCVHCIRHSAQARHQLMGQLPAERATAARPFFNSGVDYAGPIQIRTSKGRGHHSYKGYICLFVCMATRAIHIECVSDLTTQGFLAAFKRFVARRGHCAELWSDNGTNFVGASRELGLLFSTEKSSIALEIAEQLANNGTTWHFIPPHAPDFGGLWEAGVRATKHHLKRIIGCSTLTYEEISTVLSQIEACLNSRPISKVSTHPGDPTPLTPGHFLIGEPLITAPDISYEKSNIGTLRRWQLIQRMTQDFWRRWSKEYLTQFHHRYKWSHRNPEPNVGEVVLVMEDDLPPARWLYGIIEQKHTGLDGVTRVVSLKCKGTVIKRPVSKLCFLPTST